jgi:hypothetical protein
MHPGWRFCEADAADLAETSATGRGSDQQKEHVALIEFRRAAQALTWRIRRIPRPRDVRGDPARFVQGEDLCLHRLTEVYLLADIVTLIPLASASVGRVGALGNWY